MGYLIIVAIIVVIIIIIAFFLYRRGAPKEADSEVRVSIEDIKKAYEDNVEKNGSKILTQRDDIDVSLAVDQPPITVTPLKISTGVPESQTSVWGDWGLCSEECGEGTQIRQCVQGDCIGDKKRICINKKCDPIWSNWSACSESCGKGTQTRQCVQGGCIGDNVRACMDKECDPIWSNWSACSKECGIGTQTRQCMKGECTGDDERACNVSPCTLPILMKPGVSPYIPPSIDGIWGEWSECTKECGGGTQSRVCSGVECIGDNKRPCNINPCAVPFVTSLPDSTVPVLTVPYINIDPAVAPVVMPTVAPTVTPTVKAPSLITTILNTLKPLTENTPRDIALNLINNKYIEEIRSVQTRYNHAFRANVDYSGKGLIGKKMIFFKETNPDHIQNYLIMPITKIIFKNGGTYFYTLPNVFPPGEYNIGRVAMFVY
jgi:hypothetical protein